MDTTPKRGSKDDVRHARIRLIMTRSRRRAALVEERSENWHRKEGLIAEVRALVQDEAWRHGSAPLVRLMAAWKEIGPACLDIDPELEADFGELCATFFQELTAKAGR